MDNRELKKLVKAHYNGYKNNARNKHLDDLWPEWDTVRDIVNEGELVEVIELLVAEATVSDDIRFLFYIGAGEFEDTFCRFGLDAVNEFKKMNTLPWQVRVAIAGVWQSKMTDEVFTAVQSLV